MDKTVLVVEDELKLREVIALFLRAEGLKVLEATTGEEAMDFFRKNKVDAILLDVMLPDMKGFDICSRIREYSDVPILMLSVLGDDDYLTLGYQTGADDYIVKPFKASILTMKVQRLLRLHSRERTSSKTGRGVELDAAAFRCTVDGTDIKLTNKEFQLLQLLVENEGRTMTRDALLNVVWGYDYYGDSRIVDNHIKNIRHKLKHYSTHIKTVISVGYKYLIDI